MFSLITEDSVEETSQLVDLLQNINDVVNQMPYVADINQQHKPEYWDSRIALFREGKIGNHALDKWKQLIEFGVPEECLFLTICYPTYEEEGHLVLMVRTSATDWILDNLLYQITEAGDLNYTWVARRTPKSGEWVKL